MKIYRVTWRTPHMGNHIDYASNKKDAEKIILKAKKDCDEYIGEKDSADVDDIDLLNVPTDKKGLINFLKTHTPDLNNG